MEVECNGLDELWFAPGSEDDPFVQNGYEVDDIDTKLPDTLIEIYLEDKTIKFDIKWEILKGALHEPNVFDLIKNHLHHIENQISQKYHDSKQN